METKQDLQERTELAIVTERNQQAQTVIDLCPQFLRPELKLSHYDDSLTHLLESPRFMSPARKLKDGPDKEGKMDLIRAAIARIKETLRPAEPNQLKEVLGRLALHKGVGNYTEGQSVALINDYMRLLSDCPYDLLCKACDECVLDPHMQYFPQVGRLRDKMAREMNLRKLYLGRLNKILELSEFHEERRMEVPPKELGAMLAARFKAD